MKPTVWSILSGCSCATLTVIVGGPLIVLVCYLLWEYADIKELDAGPSVAIGAAISIPAAIILGGLTGFFVYRWRQNKESDSGQ